MATYMLVHGGWDGGWAWTPVAKKLRSTGHEVFTPTLTGSGERAHLASPEIDLDTHILDVVNVLHYEDLHEVVLVGSSGGGMVITGVAEKAPERIDRLIYLDAFAPRDGESIWDMLGPELQASFEQVAEERGDGWRVPTDPDADRRTDVMLKMVKQPLALTNPDAARLQRTYVLFTDRPPENPLASVFGRIAARLREDKGWSYLERPFKHYPALDPDGGVDKVTELLLELIA
jgi:pimeloyl-ACP methyl ester carboxylesterase